MDGSLTHSLISLEAKRLFSHTPDQPFSEGGYPLLTRRIYKSKIRDVRTRMKAFLEVFRYYYFRHTLRNGHLAYEVVPWTAGPEITAEESAPTPEALLLLEVLATTSDPDSAVDLLSSHTETGFEVMMEAHVQLSWRRRAERVKNSPAFKASLDPEVRYLLTKEGQALWFVNIATDPTVEVKDRIRSMVEAGKIQGHYSEKLRLLHEGLPDPQNLQQITNNNLIVGTDITNKFRKFMQDKLQLNGPEETTEPDPDVIDVEPETTDPDPEPPTDPTPGQPTPSFLS